MTKQRQASAVLLVLIMSILMLVGSMSLWRANQTQETQALTNLPRVQAEYLARGLHQLAVLKSRLLPQPLHHGSLYAVGKNPFFPHYRHDGQDPYDHLNGDSRTNSNRMLLGDADFAFTGPAFFTGVDNPTDRPAATTGLQDWNFDGSEDPDIVERLLTRFRLDLADRTAAARLAEPWGGRAWVGQNSISISDTTDDPIMGVPDPYSGSFEVSQMRILGGRNGQAYTEDALMVVVDSRVATQVKGLPSNWESRVRRVYRVQRQ